LDVHISLKSSFFLDHARALYYSQKDISNGVSHVPIKNHLTPTLKGFVVGSQIFNLVPDPSFDHNSCILGLNEQCNGTLGITLQKKIPMVSCGPNLVFVHLSNQSFEHSGLSHKCNSQNGSALGGHWAPSLTLSPICEKVCFTLKHTFLTSWALALHT
jgi:hypothetical protein